MHISFENKDNWHRPSRCHNHFESVRFVGLTFNCKYQMTTRKLTPYSFQNTIKVDSQVLFSNYQSFATIYGHWTVLHSEKNLQPLADILF